MMKQIMVRAWEIARKGQQEFGGNVKEYFAEALKISWQVEKSTVTIEVEEKQERIVAFQDWFINNNFDSNEAYAIRNEAERFEILRETEKAYRFAIHTPYGKIFTWAPKSVCLTEEQERQQAEKALNAWENGLKRNKELRQKAIELGVKGVGPKSRLRTATLERKIKEHMEQIA